MSRLSRIALSKRSVTLLFAGALFIAGISAWGSLQAGAAARHRLPGHHRRHAVSGRRLIRRHGADHQADRERHQRRSRGSSSCSRPRRTRSRWSSPSSRSGRTSRRRPRPITEAIAKANLPATAQPTIQALNINASPVVVSSIAATGSGGLEEVARDRPDRDRPRDRGDRRRRARRPDRRPRGAGLHHPRPGEDGRRRDHQSADRRHPAGQQPDPAVRPARDRRLADAGVDDRDLHLDRPDPEPRRRLRARRADRPDRPVTRRLAGGQRRPGRRRRRSPSATSGRSSPTSSRRPGSAGPTATRR